MMMMMLLLRCSYKFLLSKFLILDFRIFYIFLLGWVIFLFLVEITYLECFQIYVFLSTNPLTIFLLKPLTSASDSNGLNQGMYINDQVKILQLFH